jgi:hypothetical protein
MGLAGKEQWCQLSEGLLGEGTLTELELSAASLDNKLKKTATFKKKKTTMFRNHNVDNNFC